MILTNELPRLSDRQRAHWPEAFPSCCGLRRVGTTSEDTQLTARLKKKLPAILLWALDEVGLNAN